MRVALCLHGVVGHLYTNKPQHTWCEDVDYRIGLEHYRRHLFAVNDCVDVFIHSWSTQYAERLTRDYQPRRQIFETQIDFKQDTVKLNLKSRWYSTQAVVELKKKYEQDQGFTYDWVSCCRASTWRYYAIWISQSTTGTLSMRPGTAPMTARNAVGVICSSTRILLTSIGLPRYTTSGTNTESLTPTKNHTFTLSAWDSLSGMICCEETAFNWCAEFMKTVNTPATSFRPRELDQNHDLSRAPFLLIEHWERQMAALVEQQAEAWPLDGRPRLIHLVPWDLTVGGAQRMLDLWCSHEAQRWDAHILTAGARDRLLSRAPRCTRK